MQTDVDAVVAEAARSIEKDLPVLTKEMTDWFVEVIPEFRHDEAVRQLMIASTASNLAAIVDVLAHAIPNDQITIPPAASEYARRFAQLSLSLEALLRAYRLGENRFVQWAIAALDRLGGVSTEVALAAVASVSLRTNGYIDQVIEGLIDIYETERRRWTGRGGSARAAQIRLVLESENLSEDAARQLLGLPLVGWHVAAVAWLSEAGPGTDAALQVASRLLQQASGGGTPLTMLADECTLWAWIQPRMPHELDMAGLRAGVAAARGGLRIALGAPDRGLAGFRGSLREALRARSVAEASEGGDRSVVRFDDVAVAALLTRETDDLRRWGVRVLGKLAADDRATRQLRDTLRAFLDANGSYTQAAAQLHLHKNTVHYRVRKAEELRGVPIAENRLELEVALRAVHLLGRRLAAPVTV